MSAQAVDDDNDHTLLVVLLAALAHDVGHVGLTNAYLVETGHDFAVRYNDQSPLENYHVATALAIVEAKGFWDSFDAPGKRMGRLYWIECVLATDMAHHMAAMAQLDGLLRNIAAGDRATFDDSLFDPSTWPPQARGAGFMEAPRGALAHWVAIEKGKIANYQAVVPSTWNAGPRDARGQDGPYEAALRGHRLADATRPLEILRTIHSFDPCLACAVHVIDPGGRELVEVKVL